MKIKERYTLIHDIYVDLKLLESRLGPEDPVTGCRMPIAGARHRQGYLFQHAIPVATGIGKMMTAHRILARLKYDRAIAAKETVYHTCLNMACCNLDHLAVGDMQAVQDQFVLIGKSQNRFRPSGQVREIKPQSTGRYKYSIEELLYVRYHSREQIQQHFNISQIRAASIKSYVKRNGYKWLDLYDRYKTDSP
jgi:hypothetical protein